VMFEQDAERLIKAAGWKISQGPYYNVNLGRRGIHVWSIKSVLSADELKKHGIKPCKNAPPGKQRTVRFRGIVNEAGVLTAVVHLTTSQRKKLASGKRGKSRRPQKKTSVQDTDQNRNVIDFKGCREEP